MNGDGQPGRDDKPRPGMFRSGSEAVATIFTWLVMSIPIVFLLGLYGKLVYIFFMWGWGLID
jgi:hypothetical protein